MAWWIFGIHGEPASLPPSGGEAAHSPGSVPHLDKTQSPASGKPLASPQPGSIPQTLEELRKWIESLPADEAISWIRSFLKNESDKNTGLSFEIAANGSLKEWPTFRTYLLDTLLAIDPSAAASISREILSAPTTADEWALALRNVGRAEDSHQCREFLRQKTGELIQNPVWQANPSVGYLNAFDVLVHTHAIESTPLLSTLVQNKDRKDLAHAAFLTLDRLVQRQPAEMLERLSADSSLTASRPEMAAQQFARADLRDDRQREIVKSWLLDPARTVTELGSFAGVYPNNNKFISNNLLTRESQQSGADLSAHDREALEILESWTNDPAFQSVKPQLLSMIARLDGFLAAPQTPPSPEE